MSKTKIPTRLVATRPMRVGRKSVAVGETFTAKDEAEARYLMNINKACTPEEWEERQSAGSGDETDVTKMKIAQLRQVAEELGIDHEGLSKAELLAAVQEVQAEA